MGDNKKEKIVGGGGGGGGEYDACLDLTLRRFVYSSFAGAFAGLLLFRSPQTRWASIAFGAGIGIGSAYTESSRIFDAPTTNKAPPLPSEPPTINIAFPSEAPTTNIALPSEPPTQDSE